MSITTRLTKEVALRLLSSNRYVMDLKNHSPALSGGKLPVYLTFDDGPHPERTPKIIDQLSDINAKATFFVLGESAKKHPEIVRKLITEGHSIGSHSWSHWSAEKVPATQWLNDIQKARDEIESISGQACKLFRPPYGELTPQTLLGLLKTNTRIIQWSHDSKDFEAKTGAQFEKWFIDNKPSFGSVILMHDNQDLTSQHLKEGCSHWLPSSEFLAIPMNISDNTQA